MHDTLLLCLGLLLAVCLLVGLSQRLRVAYPILLVLGGLGLSLLPGLPLVRINPDLIFLVFLPPLLYEAAWTTSWKDFWRWRRVILFFAFGMVLLTAACVALAARAFIPGCTLALGFVLGGIVSPTDAVAATSIMRSMGLPRRLLAILEGESLVNDASGLVVIRFATMAVVSGTFVWHQAAMGLVLMTGVGIAVGLGVAGGFYAIHRWLRPAANLTTVLTLTAPYLMYVLAEGAHGSGVLAVVSGGLFLSYHSHTVFSATARQQAYSTWNTLGFVFNGAVFMLIGLELPEVVAGLDGTSRWQAVEYGLLISAVIIGVRLVAALAGSPFSTFMSRFITVADDHPGWRGPLVAGYSGMRGVVSLAAALAIPLLGAGGQPFPLRNLLIFITFVVILVTLVGQGLTLPLLIRWVGGVEDRDHLRPAAEQHRALQQLLAQESLTELAQRYDGQAPANELLDLLQHHYELAAHADGSPTAADTISGYNAVLAELLRTQRQRLMQLRQQNEYDDEVIRQLENELDLKEELAASVLPRDTAARE
ncbi:Na+/H+ antiporter [Hymenobacter sp. RP-2-7]|uniref:Na+/H+ antiporter n=1 Tax=Hymenobacter polaris TaxID=2682546 RepID=A0A7Y0ADX9_9BACT|nr:Na+/H+ antiporter [Hymenobacter polaris]NML65544.1 Na+/H+ antiporter [Hymenobacter polaris]